MHAKASLRAGPFLILGLCETLHNKTLPDAVKPGSFVTLAYGLHAQSQWSTTSYGVI